MLDLNNIGKYIETSLRLKRESNSLNVKLALAKY